MRRIFTLLLWLAFMMSATFSFAQESVMLVTYGSDAMTIEGDNDFKQIIFFQIPKAVSDPLYLRILDADCGDELDSAHGSFDTETRFRLYGGTGAYSAATLKKSSPD